MGALSVVTGLGWSWVLNLSTPGTVRSWVAPATGAGIFLTDLAHLVGIGVPLHTMLSVTRGLGVLVARRRRGVAAAAVGPHRGAARHGPHHAGRSWPSGPVVQPWYLSWGLVVLAPVATGKVRTLIVGLVDRGRLHRAPRRPAAGVGPLPRRPADGGGRAARVPGHPDRAADALRPRAAPGPVAPARRRAASGPALEDAGPRARLRRRLSRPARPARRSTAPAAGASEHPLQDGHVDPAAELAPHLALDADQGEAARPVEGDRGLVVARRSGRSRCGTPGAAARPTSSSSSSRPTPWPRQSPRRRRRSPPPWWRRRPGRGTATASRSRPRSAPSTATTAGWAPWWRAIHARWSARLRGSRSKVTVEPEDLDVVDGADGLGVLLARQPDLHRPIVPAASSAPPESAASPARRRTSTWRLCSSGAELPCPPP